MSTAGLDPRDYGVGADEPLLPAMTGTATFSPDGLYRYDLTRHWGDEGEAVCLWVMLNPSTADATKNDQTISRCIYYSIREGFGGLAVCNLYAYRATQPGDLLKAGAAARGPDNEATIEDWLERPAVTACVCAWGATKLTGLPPRPDVEIMANRAQGVGVRLLCLGRTRNGQPKHPARLGNDAPLMPWP